MHINFFPDSTLNITNDLKDAVVTATGSTYDGTTKHPTVSVSYNSQTLTENVDYILSNNSAVNAGDYTLLVKGINLYKGITSAAWTIAKASGSITPSKDSVTLAGAAGTQDTVTFTSNAQISAVSSNPGICTVSVEGNTVTFTSVDEGECTVTVTQENYTGSASISVDVSFICIYGVSWDKTSSTSFSRTDNSADFSDPIPAVNGGAGGSPFDELMPWAGMAKETFADGNVMVKIPKFWYKWTDETNSLKLQIADGPAEGFYVSPAHADRGDGKGERDYVYIGRYHCASDYKSKSGVKPIANITRATARSGCVGLGTGYYQLDYAMWWTIRMLYLVEFSDWNSQAKIGYGCGDGSATHNSGQSDNAQYHTGSMQSSRTTYGAGIQYRYIEDPWGNVRDWCDGIVLSNGAAYVTNDMSKYGDTTTNHTKVGDAPTGSGNCISGWTVPSVSGLEWALWPKSKVSDSNYATYVADYVGTSNACPSVGGYYYQGQYYGMFCSYGGSASYTSGGLGARLQYLP